MAGVIAQTDPPEQVDAGQEAGDGLTFDPEFSGPDDAMEWLLHPPADVCYPVSVPKDEDDSKSVQEGGSLNQQLVDGLFKAISEKPREVPQFGEPHQRLHYNKTMKTTVAVIKAKMESEDFRKMAKGFCMRVIDQVVHVNRVGIPMTAVDAAKGSSRKRKPDKDMKCSERAWELIECVRRNKLIAVDVMEGRSLNDMAYSPTAYENAKIENTKSNATRALETAWQKRQKKAAKEKDENGLSGDTWYDAYCQSFRG